VDVPTFGLPFTKTETPLKPSWVSALFTLPVMVADCAKAPSEKISAIKSTVEKQKPFLINGNLVFRI
jgi:hypothetical protein